MTTPTATNAAADDKTVTNEGCIKMVISNVKEMNGDRSSQVKLIGGVPWRLEAQTRCSKRTGKVKYFGLYAACNVESESNLWSCEAKVKLQVVSAKDNDVYHELTKKFVTCDGWGEAKLIAFDTLVDPDLGYISPNGSVTVQMHVSILNTIGIQFQTFDFTQPTPHSDVVLLIGDARLHINKHYLSLYSPVAAAMFYSPFVESQLDEIKLEDVTAEDFIELLHVIYPSHKSITDDSVECLLELADRYQITYVMRECEEFLLNMFLPNETELMTKLIWADKYKLAKLHNSCLQMLHSTRQIKQIKDHDLYEQLSDATKIALFDKMCSL